MTTPRADMLALPALLALLAALGLVSASRTASADPLRLRGDVYADSRAPAPAGLLALDVDGDLRPWLSAEALVWVGAGADAELDALVIAMRARDPEGRGDARLGRFLVVPGAVRPVHLDGASGLLRSRAAALELFGGVPVAPRFGARAYDWAAGGRVSRPIGEWGSAGVAYLQSREQGRLADHEVGIDAGFAPIDRLDVGVRLAYDLSNPGVSDAMVSAAVRAAPRALPWRRRPWRLELHAGYRSPARILPATSLFTVLGDAASRHAGATVTWRAAPRLDVVGTAAVRAYAGPYGGDPGADACARAILRLDDRGAGSVALELRRSDVPEAAWTGARIAVHVPVLARSEVAPARQSLVAANPGVSSRLARPAHALAVSAEIEVVAPDDPRGRGALWPWGVIATSAGFGDGWSAAVAIEAGASPQHAWRVDAIARVSRAWELP